MAAGLALGGPPAAAQSFGFTPEAGAALRALWETSAAAGEERAACLAAAVRGDSVIVSRVLTLPPEAADSLGISAVSSIERCGPPEWAGTVHTHVALYTETLPSRRFSGQDRQVMSLWHDRWRVRGVFCVLYSERDAHCEASGVARRPRPRVVK